ncbi:MAG: hypothetical protein NTX79_08480 [Candidatus Micrarchaeota archaeon]|nr:hypothetical protein [Candidatus Micrarchaeota archaeon]
MTAEPPTLPEMPHKEKPALSAGQMKQIAEFSQRYLSDASEAVAFSEVDFLSNLGRLYMISKKQGSNVSLRHAKRIEKLAMTAFSAFGPSRLPSHIADTAGSGVRKGKSHIKAFVARSLPKESQPAIAAPAISLSGICIGARRLEIEFEDPNLVKTLFEAHNIGGQPPTLAEMVEKYTGLAESISQILKDGLGIKPDLKGGRFSSKMQESFISGIWGVMNGNLEIKYGENKHGMLWESLLTKIYDCDNSAFLVFDVAARLGMPLWILTVPEHALVRTKSLFFETTSGIYSDSKSLREYYPIIYIEISQSDAAYADALSYENRGFAKSRLKDYEGAIADYGEAIRLSPKDAGAFQNRGIDKLHLGDPKGAIEDCSMAISLDPFNADAYFNRGNVKQALGDKKGAKEDYLRAAELFDKQGRAGRYNVAMGAVFSVY